MISSSDIVKIPNLIRKRMSGQPDTFEIKYKETYQKIGSILNTVPEIKNNIRAAGLGSTAVLENLKEINKSCNDFCLDLYSNFETGYGVALPTLFELACVYLPYWREQSIPIEVIPASILSKKEYLARSVNLFDFDSITSLTSRAGMKESNKIPDLLSFILEDRSIVHLNFIVCNFRVKGNYPEFKNKLDNLISYIEESFEIKDLVYTKYSTKKCRSTTQMGGCILNLKRK